MSDEPEAQEQLPEDEVDEIVLGDRYRILPASRLPELDQPGTFAVTARDERNPGDTLFARICSSDAIPRVGAMEDLRNLHEANLLRPIEWGAVEWPGDEERRYAVVFPRPDGPPLMPSYKSKIIPLTSDDISNKVLAPAVATLDLLKPRGLTHRAIRPENIYFAGQKKSTVVLGDCVTASPAAQQPAMFETIEMAMTPPIGRGPGTVCDDIYALGVSVLILSMGESPIRNLSDQDIIAAKIARGSFSALMGERRPPFGLRELLRGMLSDDPIERWGLDELEEWLGGSLRRSVQQSQENMAKRPYAFNGFDYGHCRLIAQAFGEKWETATGAIRSVEFDKWLRRNAADPGLADKVKSVLQGDGENGGGSSAKLVSSICMALDNVGPIRYKGISTMPDGIGATLAAAFLRKDQKAIQIIGECLATGIPTEWFMVQSEAIQLAMEPQQISMKQIQPILRNSGPGYGIERVLYVLNPHLPCLSPVLDGKYVTSIRNLLPTLEEVVRERDMLPATIDRHLAAFIASRFKQNIDRTLSSLVERKENPMSARLGMLTLLAKLQMDFGPEGLPYLTEWLARELEPALSNFHMKSRREMLSQKLGGVARGGDLVALSRVVNDESLLRQDEMERKLATREFTQASREIAALQSKEFHDSNRRTGWQVAAGLSMCIAFAAMSIVVLY